MDKCHDTRPDNHCCRVEAANALGLPDTPPGEVASARPIYTGTEVRSNG